VVPFVGWSRRCRYQQRFDVQVATEVDGRGIDGQALTEGPEIELVSAFATAEAVESVPVEVGGEAAAMSLLCGIVEGTVTANLSAVTTRRLEAQQVQDLL
jgi:hypothetical protein